MPRSADRNQIQMIQMKCKNYDRMIDLHSPAHGNITCRNKVCQFCKITGVEITNKSELISFIARPQVLHTTLLAVWIVIARGSGEVSAIKPLLSPFLHPLTVQ